MTSASGERDAWQPEQYERFQALRDHKRLLFWAAR